MLKKFHTFRKGRNIPEFSSINLFLSVSSAAAATKKNKFADVRGGRCDKIAPQGLKILDSEERSSVGTGNKPSERFFFFCDYVAVM